MRAIKRFYKIATVTADLGVALDGKPVKTPGKAALLLPTAALAEAVAAEWQSQGEKVLPSTMLLTKLANTAIDRVGPEKPRIVAEMVDYAESDLVCYRAGRPPDLVERQNAMWNPVIAWALVTLDAPFEAVPGVMHRPQSPEALRAVGEALGALNDYQLAALHNIVTITGSALIALMLAKRAILPDAAWEAAHVDEDFQIAQWGQDEEAAARRQRRLREFLACCRFVELCRTQS